MDREIEIHAYMPITLYATRINTRELEEVIDILVDKLKEQGYEIIDEEDDMILFDNIGRGPIIEPAEYMFVKHFDLMDEHNRIDMRTLFFEDCNGKRLCICMASLNAKWVPKELNTSMIVLINDSVPKEEFEQIRKILEPIIWLIPGDDILTRHDIIRWPDDIVNAYKSGFIRLIIEIILVWMLRSQLIQYVIRKAIKGNGPKDEHISVLWAISSFFDIRLEEITKTISIKIKMMEKTAKNNEKNRNDRIKRTYVIEFLNKYRIDASKESSIVNLIVSEAQVRINKHILWLTIIVVVFGILSLLLQLGLIQRLIELIQ